MAQKKGPDSVLKTGDTSVDTGPAGGKQQYSVQVHTNERGLEVLEPISATSGDEAASIALKQHGYSGTSVRGVTPYSDPDANSLGGERDALHMMRNAENGGDAGIDAARGTPINRETSEKLGKTDIKDLGE